MSSGKKQSMFDDNDDQEINFRIANKKVTESIDKKLERKFVDKAKNRMGKQEFDKVIQDEDEESSTDEEEDEFGTLVNSKVSDKFLSTLAKLKTKKAEIYNAEKQYFSDSDFENDDDDDEDILRNQGKFSYKEMVAKSVKDKMDQEGEYSDEGDSDEEQQKKNKKVREETPHEEQLRLKEEFKQKLKEQEGSDDEDLFKVKKKPEMQIDDEDEAFEILKKKYDKNEAKESKLIDEMWGDKEKLDDKDKFLRKFILTKGWIDRDDYNDAIQSEIDQEDEERDEEMENFETEYNFRFEEPGAAKVFTYERNIEDSMRNKTSKRAEKRKEKKMEKLNEKQQMQEDIKRLKNVKKQEILDRLQKIQKIGGIDEEEAIINEDMEQFLEKDFDQEEFDRVMKKKFGKNYRKGQDLNEEELKQYEKQQLEEELPSDIEEEAQENAPKKNKAKDDKDVTIAKTNIPIAIKKNLNNDEIKAIQEDDNGEGEEEGNNMLCWYCDNCQRGLQPGEQRFDCLTCPDYVLCRECNGAQIHKQHKLKKFIVPQGCAPPEEEVLQSIISKFKICKKCDAKLNEYTDYYTLDSDDQYNLCDECFDKEKLQQQSHYNKVEATKVDISQVIQNNDIDKVQSHFNDDVINKLVQEYYSMDFEDVIAGGLKTKFKYQSVKPESYGLSDENLLYADPALLNNYVSLKKLAPYRDDEGHVTKKVLKNKQKIRDIENSTRLVKYSIRKEAERMQYLQDKINKLKKAKKSDKKIEKYINKLEKLKQQRKQPITKAFFKKIKNQEDSELSEDEEDQNNKKYKKNKNKVEIEDLSQKKEKIRVSDSRLSTYGIKQNE